MHDLKAIYLEALAQCAPERILNDIVEKTFPTNVVAIGKCAGTLLEGVASRLPIERAFAVVPEGYKLPRLDDVTKPRELVVVAGGHPGMTAATFEAGRALLRFIGGCRDALFLISGGGSACVDVPLAPWFTEHDLAAVNTRLVASGLPIGSINTVRKRLSAIKGGRLAARVPGRKVTLIYSDVSSRALDDVASGPTMPDRSSIGDALAILERIGGCDRIIRILSEELPPPVQQLPRSEVRLLASNQTLTDAARDAAAGRGFKPVTIDEQIEGTAEEAAEQLAIRSSQLQAGEILIAGGEPTVAVRGSGRGGRCSELAMRFAAALQSDREFAALFGSSDGLDGNSGAAGVELPEIPLVDRAELDRHLQSSDTFSLAEQLGRAIIIPATGNNLRDLFLIARI